MLYIDFQHKNVFENHENLFSTIIIMLVETILNICKYNFKYSDVTYDQRILTLPSGQRLCLDSLRNSAEKTNEKIILMIPGGIRGSSEGIVYKMLSSRLIDENYDAIYIINHIGLGGGIKFISSKITLHYDYSTIECAMKHLVEELRYDPHNIHAIGISMGAFMLSYYLLQENNLDHSRCYFPSRYVFLAHYFTLKNHTNSVRDCWWLQQYALNGINNLKNQVIADLCSDQCIPDATSIDDAIENILFQFTEINSWDAYYSYNFLQHSKLCSTKTLFKKCLFINASNDPLSSSEFLDYIQKDHEYLPLHITPTGGHLGWDEDVIIPIITNFLLGNRKVHNTFCC
jgi:predicted alpha/beta-fold hydrolase